MHLRSFLALALLACGATAQTASFGGMTWGPVTVGQLWPIYWRVGDGTPVSLFLGNTTWTTPVAVDRPAADGEYDWTVAVPAGFVPGSYALALVQSGAMDYSSLFSVDFASAGASSSVTSNSTTTTSSTASVTVTKVANNTLVSASAQATVAVTYWDEECGCTRTSAIPSCVATDLPGNPYTWWDETCGCTKTATGLAPTMPAANNYTVPTGPNVPPSPPAPAATASSQTRYTGAGHRLMHSGVVVVGLVAAVLLA